MLGAVIGDVVGSPYEGVRPPEGEWPLFTEASRPTDDTVMTFAVARAFMDVFESGADLEDSVVREMRRFAGLYPDAGYGTLFRRWLASDPPRPYGSFGNGSAMRVSSVGWLFDDPAQAARVAEATARPTHDHPEGLRGARAVACCVCLARTGAGKDEIRDYVRRECGYAMDFTLRGIEDGYGFDSSCQGSVPVAIEAFLESSSYEDAVRKAVSLGGDSDTLACMAGSIAEAAWGIPEDIASEGVAKLDELLSSELRRWRSALARMRDFFSGVPLGEAVSARR